MSKKKEPEDLTVVHVDNEPPPNEQQTESPGVSAAITSAVGSGVGNLPSNVEDE